MRRRGFLGLSAAAAAGLLGWRLWRSSEYSAIVAIIEKRLDYLKKDPQGVHTFARDLAAEQVISSKRLRALSVFGNVYALFPPSTGYPFAEAIRHGEERVTSKYLLSSDFFVNGADESRVVRYLGMYDPVLGCRNPFARFTDS